MTTIQPFDESSIILDKENYENCRVRRSSLIEELGDPIKCAPDDTISEADIIARIEKHNNLEAWEYTDADNKPEIRYKYHKQYSYCTAEEENGLEGEISFDIYTREDGLDAFWDRESYVVVGDEIYYLGDCEGIANTDFFNWNIGWYCRPLRDPEIEDDRLEEVNEVCSAEHSGSSATHELWKHRRVSSQIIWSERRQRYLGRLKAVPYVVAIYPDNR